MVKPTEVKAKAQSLEEQNCKFRIFLKNRANEHELDAQFLSLHKELFSEYNCRKCANCCKSCSILLAEDDITRISSFLEMAEDDFAAEYLADADEDDEKPYVFKGKPCPFLHEDGSCGIQSCKPDVCDGYPFTDKPGRLWSLYSVIEHAEVCPVVFEILERLKKMYGFRNVL